MSDETVVNPEPDAGGGIAVVAETPLSAPSACAVAEQFVATEHARALKALGIARIASIAVVVVFGAVMLYITNGFTSSLEPHTAAEIATGLIATQVNERGPELVNQFKEKVPELIRQTPDYIMKEMPGYRGQLEDRVEQELSKYAQSTSDQLGSHLDAVLDAHKENVKTLVASAKDPAALQDLSAGFRVELMKYIDEAPPSGQSIRSQIDESLHALQEISAKVKRLSANKGLTPQEAKTRQAIAILARNIDQQRKELSSAR